jgi:hypothetical protein
VAAQNALSVVSQNPDRIQAAKELAVLLGIGEPAALQLSTSAKQMLIWAQQYNFSLEQVMAKGAQLLSQGGSISIESLIALGRGVAIGGGGAIVAGVGGYAILNSVYNPEDGAIGGITAMIQQRFGEPEFTVEVSQNDDFMTSSTEPRVVNVPAHPQDPLPDDGSRPSGYVQPTPWQYYNAPPEPTPAPNDLSYLMGYNTVDVQYGQLGVLASACYGMDGIMQEYCIKDQLTTMCQMDGFKYMYRDSCAGIGIF